VWALYLALLELPASEASILLLQNNSRRQGSDLYHALDSYMSNTKLLRSLLAEPLYPSSNFGTLSKGSITPHESIELPKHHLQLVSHAISSQSPGLPPRSQYFVVRNKPSDEARVKPQTIHGAAHL